MPGKVVIDFIGIGAQKSGTSWLYSNLRKLPDFTLPSVKEIHYFSRSRQYPSPSLFDAGLLARLSQRRWRSEGFNRVLGALKGRDPNGARRHLRWYFSISYNDRWYLSLFKRLNGIKGEISPDYSMLTVEDIRKMVSVVPDAKFILLLRNPVDRAWSHFRMDLAFRNMNSIDSVSNAEIIAFMNSPRQERKSDYLSTLKNYGAVIPDEKLLIGFYDAIIENPQNLLEDIVRFIGGNPENISTHCSLFKKQNVSPKVPCPPEILAFLKQKYHDQIRELADRFGGYFANWYNSTYSTGTELIIRPDPTFFLSSVHDTVTLDKRNSIDGGALMSKN